MQKPTLEAEHRRGAAATDAQLLSLTRRESCVKGHLLASVVDLPPHFKGAALSHQRCFIFCSLCEVSSQQVAFLLFPDGASALRGLTSQWRGAGGCRRRTASQPPWCGRDIAPVLTIHWSRGHTWLQGDLGTVLTGPETTVQRQFHTVKGKLPICPVPCV